jgi:predicted Zn-dependent peptidase
LRGGHSAPHKYRPPHRAEAIDAIGGEVNAATSKEWTNFYIKARKDALATSFDVLSDMILNPILDPEEIEKEKGVIIEEMAMYEDTPMYRVGEIFEQVIFEGTALGPDVIGTKETVSGITKDDFVLYRSKQYYPENIVITVAGGVQEKEVMELAKKYFGALQSSMHETVEPIVVTQNKPKVHLVEKKNEQAHIVLGFLGNKKGTEERFAEALLATILGGGMSSRIWLEVREKRGLAYSVQTDVDHYRDTGYISTYAGVEVGKIDNAIEVILEEYYALARETKPLTEKEIRKAKEYLKGHIALSLEDTKRVTRFVGEDELILGKSDSVEKIYEGLESVTKEDILRVAKKFCVPERLNLAIIGPYDNVERFKNIVIPKTK